MHPLGGKRPRAKNSSTEGPEDQNGIASGKGKSTQYPARTHNQSQQQRGAHPSKAQGVTCTVDFFRIAIIWRGIFFCVFFAPFGSIFEPRIFTHASSKQVRLKKTTAMKKNAPPTGKMQSRGRGPEIFASCSAGGAASEAAAEAVQLH